MISISPIKKIQLSTIVTWVSVLVALEATAQCILGNLKSFEHSPAIYTSYNNFIIFRNSFFHLVRGQDLYKLYLHEQWDLYKYSPNFSFLFAIFAYLPDFVGLLCWNVLNTFPILIGVKYLKGLTDYQKSLALLFCLAELSGSLQNSQSNGLTTGLIILTFTALEYRKYFIASLFVVLSIYIKIYGGIALLFFLFYPSRIRHIAYVIFWLILIGVLPLLQISWHQLVHLYGNWWQLLKTDEVFSRGISVSGILYSWFHFNVSKIFVALVGFVIFLLPLYKFDRIRDYGFRFRMLCSTLVWVVIFNHKSESPTFIIALLGISLWYFSGKRTFVNTVLIILTFLLTTLSVSDLVPAHIKHVFFEPYCIKALMPLIVWIKITTELINWNVRADDPSVYLIHHSATSNLKTVIATGQVYGSSGGTGQP
jgi:hypothetical protein